MSTEEAGLRPLEGARGDGPWFRGRPLAAVVVVAALFAGVLGLRFAIGTADDALALLYALPIALVAVAFGFRAGVAAGALGIALVVLWVLVEGVELSALGWVARAAPLLLLGGLLGDATDRLRASETRRRALEVAAERHRDAVEINDTVVQGMAAAKWALEAGQHERGLQLLSDTITQAQQLVSELLREADMGPGGGRGRA
ncbi:hypothetical protein [Thalassiella azotivora]